MQEEILEWVVVVVKYVKFFVEDVEFYVEDVGCIDNEYFVCVLEVVIKVGAIIFNILDIIGYCFLEEYGVKICYLCENVEGIEKVIFFIYCYNDLGLAIVNFIVGV